MVQADCMQASKLFQDDGVTEPLASKIVLLTASLPMTTHVFNVIAGPFVRLERRKNGLPVMKIYVRPSLISQVNHQEMFDVVESGITFYEDFFGCPFPFDKYD